MGVRLVKVPRESLNCVLISGCILVTLTYCDFAPHHEQLSYLPGDIRQMAAPQEARIGREVAGLEGAQGAAAGVVPSTGAQAHRSCAAGSQDERHVVEDASCLAPAPLHQPGDAVP